MEHRGRNRDEIIRLLREHRPELERLGVKSLALFGSTARGEAREESDVDLLVEFQRPVGLFEFVDLKGYLENLLGCRVDLGTPASLKPQLRDPVLKEAVYVP
ncbi:MAG: nucleotidyltransferase family protein [candidate division NC10 bacterium]|nr:nucleotidyltransferase family protein [candidate division NC10 bacterium]